MFLLERTENFGGKFRNILIVWLQNPSYFVLADFGKVSCTLIIPLPRGYESKPMATQMKLLVKFTI